MTIYLWIIYDQTDYLFNSELQNFKKLIIDSKIFLFIQNHFTLLSKNHNLIQY